MDVMFKGVYSGCRVLVTGHTGFKGSWLVDWLQRLQAEVCGCALVASTDPSHWRLLDLDCRSEIVDIRDAARIHQVLNEFQPEIVFHLAAQPLVRASYRDPVETYSTNVMGTLNVLEACRKSDSVRAVVNVTSDKCYENREWTRGYHEDDAMGGHDPYSSSKGCAELLASSYRNSYFSIPEFGKSHQVLLASCRAGNVIGGGDWAEDRLVPDIMRAVHAGRPVEVRNPGATRPWQHVLEPLGGYLLVGQKLLEGDGSVSTGWNFGPAADSDLSVEDVVKRIQLSWSKIDYRLAPQKNAPHEANLLKLDCTKAHEELGWTPLWDSAETFRRTVDWYREFYENGRILTQDDLAAYEQEWVKKGI